MDKQYKFRPSSKYYTISAYALVFLLLACIIIKLVFFWSDAASFIGSLVSTLEAFFLGILIAFLINPLVNWMRRVLFGKIIRVKKPGLNNAFSIVLAYILVLVCIVAAIVYIIPTLIDTLRHLTHQIGSLKSMALDIAKWADNKIGGHRLADAANTYLTKEYISKALTKFISNNSTQIVSTGISLVTTIINIIIAFIISVYLILDKQIQTRSFKRIIYAIFKEPTAKKLCYIGKRAVTIFSNFFDGKMLDSLIMGLITYAAMWIMEWCGLKNFGINALLIAIIIGVTNMIPYFGPFIGAVPSILILLVASGWQGAVVFTVYVIIIMQVDGNLIGPKILGDSTGLRPLWIIFAITIGGWAFGIVGMLIGVPIVATITGLLNDYVDVKLHQKEIDMPPLDEPKEDKDEKKRRKREERKRKLHEIMSHNHHKQNNK